MPRPIKWRNVCSLPKISTFGPIDLRIGDNNTVNLTIDEYESIRLIDFEGFNQERCAKQMKVARTTVQGIYNNARKKIAKAIIEGKLLFIDGGEYRICDGIHESCDLYCEKREDKLLIEEESI
ncbi:DUF134 domain-containing protein [Peptostreptococcus equinus]|uniref:DUF134 domain-containing protein n=1 Tax=Peptostreptococcus equinus TaxID=3003601 RepID=UPI002F2B1618